MGFRISDYELSTSFEFVINPYGIANSCNRKGFLLRGEWQDNYIEHINDNNIRAIYLNSAKGWKDFDCSFLANIKGIEELHISAPSVTNLEAIESMSSLVDLSITCSTKSVINFNKLELLEKCYLYWWNGALSIFESTSLIDLHLDSINKFPLDWGINLVNLRSVTIANSKLDNLNALSYITQLSKLQLFFCKNIIDFKPIERLKMLNWLAISNYKNIGEVDFVAPLKELKVLLLTDCGRIKTLKPLMQLSELTALSLIGSTHVEDGDLSFLLNLHKLSMLGFVPRKNYSHNLIKPWDWENYDNPDKLLMERILNK